MEINANVRAEKKSALSVIMSNSNMGIFLVYAVLFIGLSIASPHFFTVSNIFDVIRQGLFVAIMGFGMTFIIAMGGIDLSVGAIMGISGVISASLILNGTNIYLAIIITLIAGLLIGLINGVLITKFKITDFIATLAVMGIIRGIIMVWTHGIPIYGLRFPEFQFLAQGYIGPIPFPIILTIVIFALCYYLLYKTKFGRYTISIGSNAEAARLVGIQVDKIKIIAYAFTGFLCAIAGILLASRVEAAVAEAGSGYELDVIAATVIGGTSLAGGRGRLIGTAIGALLMVTIRNGLNLLNINSFWHQIVIGIFILIAVGLDRFSSKKSSNAK